MNKTIEQRARETCTPNGHNLDVIHLGACTQCGGSRIAPADRIAGATEAQDDWKRVEDGLPEYGENVLVWYTANLTHPHIRTATYISGGYFSTSGIQHDKSGKVTHWRNLPSPPSNDKSPSA